MELDDKLLDEYLPQIGSNSLVIYLLIKRNKGKIKLSEICSILNISRPTAIKERNKLIELELIKVKGKNHERFKQLEYSQPENVKDISRVKSFNSSLYNIYNIINNIIFNSTYYVSYNIPKYTNNLINNINNLVNNELSDKERLEDYCNWFLHEKNTKTFSYGLFCCDSMIQEYKLSLSSKSSSNSKVSNSTSHNPKPVDDSQLLKETLEEIYAKQKAGEPLDSDEEEILKKYGSKK